MKEKKNKDEIQPLNDDVLANLSIEELEEKLELQILQIPEAQACWDCACDGDACLAHVCGTDC